MKPVLIALTGVLLSACSNDRSELTFVNGGQEIVTNLSISDGQATWKLGDLMPKGQVVFSESLAGEGGPTIAWVSRGVRHSAKGCYYTGGVPARGLIEIVRDRLRFRCR